MCYTYYIIIKALHICGLAALKETEMKRISVIALLLFGSLLMLSACIQLPNDNNDASGGVSENDYEYEYEIPEIEPVTPEPEISYEDLPAPVDINADFEVTTNPDGTFIISTNLPDETELSLTLQGRGYLAQGKAFVDGGVAVSERFTNRGDQLVGDYTLEVLMPIPDVQSDYVKHFIGKNGEYLTGPNLKGALGTVVVSKEFKVSFAKPSADSDVPAEDMHVHEDESEYGVCFRTPNGKKYHYDRECAGKNSYRISDTTGLEPCLKCTMYPK